MIELVTTDAALVALRPLWTELWQGAPDASPFQSPEWLLGWWRQFGTGRPLVAVLREQARLLGVLPLYILDEPPARKLLPIGVGITDYFEPLLAPDVAADAVAALLRAALAHARQCNVTECALPDLPPGAALREVACAGWNGRVAAADPCPVLPLPAAIPSGKRRHIKLAQNRAERIGGWSTEIATLASAPALLEGLIALHTARWQDNGEAGVLADPRVLRFHRDSVGELVAAKLLRLQVLRFGQDIVAANYALLDRSRRVLFYLSGYDAAHARESPGTLLLARMIEDGAAEGRRELHFLRGAESYKYAWGAVDRMNAVRHMWPSLPA